MSQPVDPRTEAAAPPAAPIVRRPPPPHLQMSRDLPAATASANAAMEDLLILGGLGDVVPAANPAPAPLAANYPAIVTPLVMSPAVPAPKGRSRPAAVPRRRGGTRGGARGGASSGANASAEA